MHEGRIYFFIIILIYMGLICQGIQGIEHNKSLALGHTHRVTRKVKKQDTMASSRAETSNLSVRANK